MTLVGGSGRCLRFLVLALLLSVTLAFRSLPSATKIIRIRNINKLPRFSSLLSLSIHDVIPSSISVALEPLESYYVESIPDYVCLFRRISHYHTCISLPSIQISSHFHL